MVCIQVRYSTLGRTMVRAEPDPHSEPLMKLEPNTTIYAVERAYFGSSLIRIKVELGGSILGWASVNRHLPDGSWTVHCVEEGTPPQ